MNNTNLLAAFPLVEKFHTTFGQPIRTEPQINVPERQLRIDLITEEAEEYRVAVSENDLIETVDALGDLVYVAVGAALTHGISAEASAAVEKQSLFSYTVAEAAAKYVSAANYGAAEGGGDINELAQAIGIILNACYQAADAINVDLNLVLDEIQDSNMSKLGADGKPIYREDGKVLKGPGFFVPNIARVLADQGILT